MKKTILLTFSLATLVIAQSPGKATNATSTTSTTPLPTTTLDPTDYFDYIATLEYIFKEDNYVPFFTDAVYYTPEKYNISTKDVLSFAKLDTITLEEASALLEKYNKTFRDVLTVDNLEKALNLSGTTFYRFYTSFTQGLGLTDGTTQMSVMESLQIDGNKFASAITFGFFNVYDVLREGNYSTENINKALELSKTTMYEVFEQIRNIIVKEFSSKEVSFYKQIFDEHKMTREDYTQFWKNADVKVDDVLRVEKFRTNLDEIRAKLTREASVGVFTHFNQIIIHRKIYDIFRDFTEIITVNAGLVNHNEHFPNLRIRTNPESNFVLLESDKNATTFVGTAVHTLPTSTNCTFVSVTNNAIVSEVLNIQESNKTLLVTDRTLDVPFSVGSPLICRRTLYGLASEDRGFVILFDPVLGHEDILFSSSIKTKLEIGFMVLAFLICFL